MGLIAPISSVEERTRGLPIGGEGLFAYSRCPPDWDSLRAGPIASESDGRGPCYRRMGAGGFPPV